ncbi:MAG: DUF2075 domain-containing protein [Rubrivivax sp.]|nr:DUF2075 domain-containing protein [Rubrivivax sp.]
MGEAVSTPLLRRAWYAAPFADFAAHSVDEVIGQLTNHSNQSVELEQRDAWRVQIEFLKQWVSGRSGTVLLEFNIPRMGLRADAVLLMGGCVVILEFKVGETSATRHALAQVWQYALDTKNFHETSHAVPIVPVLIPTNCVIREPHVSAYAPDRVREPVSLVPQQVPDLLDELARDFPDPIDAQSWTAGRYRPTPTIVEAAQRLYANHDVTEIVRAEADATNLTDTAQRLESLINRARASGDKIICFVTGVPGAGKTLVGLNLATAHRERGDAHAVFLSGNGPLVSVLCEALTRDDVARRKRGGESITKVNASKPIKAFIQNVHHFRDEALRDLTPPIDRIVIFDEAQRAWNRSKTALFMRQKKGRPGFNQSEAEFLIETMDRHEGWAVIVCLVGGGQEIHTGEAGIDAWVDACTTRFPRWLVCMSDRLVEAEYGGGEALSRARAGSRAELFADLHLTVSLRSFRADKVSSFVKALLDLDHAAARLSLDTFRERYPIVLSRDLTAAKRWVKSKARANERFGLLGSSKAMRLRPHAIEVRLAADPIHYFLADRQDVRSSFYLEDCATEFQVQGLELDWACVAWDADLRMGAAEWSHHDFSGSKWKSIHSVENRRNLKNAYRVLLTRARQGMAIFVPPGDREDPTRPPAFYDRTFEYLRDLGLEVI